MLYVSIYNISINMYVSMYILKAFCVQSMCVCIYAYGKCEWGYTGTVTRNVNWFFVPLDLDSAFCHIHILFVWR